MEFNALSDMCIAARFALGAESLSGFPGVKRWLGAAGLFVRASAMSRRTFAGESLSRFSSESYLTSNRSACPR